MNKKISQTILATIRFMVNYLPFTVAVFGWKLKVLLKYILKYRSKVISQNLQNSLQNRYTDKEILEFKNEFYDIMVRYITENLRVAAWPKEKLIARLSLRNKDYWSSYFKEQKSTIIMASHYGNWELNLMMFHHLAGHRAVGFYKPISNKVVDHMMLDIRSKHGLELYPIEQTARVMSRHKSENIIYFFIGDQSPLNMNGVYWNTFLNQQTPWLNGSEKLAVKYNYPVVYIHQIPCGAKETIWYNIELEVISQNPGNEAEGAITEKYSRLLEAQIWNQPPYWLWSHKRWKRAHLKENGKSK
ncbi:MAG: lysophospholipid acyltransferase family protein [Saprospiraceae bacterium]|nr:lysophospholipid acyltransferase family protein [Saprospiraceae bacterium]